MGKFWGYFRWVRRPQLLVVFFVVCVCASGCGVVTRPALVSFETAGASPRVQGIRLSTIPDCTAVPCMALTFDDGPDPDVTPRILDILARERVKATFFMVGNHVGGREYLVRRAYAEGHEIGNHSWSHASFTKLSPADVEMQLRLTQEAIMAAGVPAPHLFRPPYGAFNGMVLAHADIAVIRWNIDPADWDSKDPQKIQEHLLAYARPGGIALLHDTQPATADALDITLRELKSHYQFVTVSQLLQLASGDHGLYFGR